MFLTVTETVAVCPGASRLGASTEMTIASYGTELAEDGIGGTISAHIKTRQAKMPAFELPKRKDARDLPVILSKSPFDFTCKLTL